MKKIRVAFVCLGNICRSPTAHAVMRALVERRGVSDRVEVDSSGTGSWHVGEPADARMRAHAEKRGVNIDTTAQRFDASWFGRFDLIVCMDHENKRDCLALARNPDDRAKVRLLREFDPQAGGDLVVPDPYYGGTHGFENVLDIVERSCEALLDSILGKDKT